MRTPRIHATPGCPATQAAYPGQLHFSRYARGTPKRNTLEEPEEESGPAPYKVYCREMVLNHYDIYLSSALMEPLQYDELCHLLRSVSSQDAVSLYLNTAGGSMASGMALIQAMSDCEAEVTTILHPEAYSMGALLFLAGDRRIAPPGSILMFHNYSSGLFGKGNEQVAEVHANNHWYEHVLREICMPFLSKAEVKALMQGRDLWLHQPEILARLARCEAVAGAEEPLAG